MTELCILSGIALCVFGFAFYQSHRDKQRWKRIASGKSLFGERNGLPALSVDGARFESKDRPVLVIWGNLKPSGFLTVQEARTRIQIQREAGNPNAKEARIFAWDGEGWKQRQ